MLIRGFRFGMLLQLAVGPVCLYIFQTGSLHGFWTAEAGVLGATLVDGMYMLAAMLGLTSLLDRKRIRPVVHWFGSAVLGLFGISAILGAFHIAILPSFSLSEWSGEENAWAYVTLLTASNPLTILFWAGVFTSKITETGLGRIDISRFALGALTATFAFLTLVALVGSLANAFLPPRLSQVLNVLVGFVLLAFALRMAVTRRKS
ncbi:LysE family transporter [uncultured Paenibacillus sp.]|uniref:LysE family translocator n=1 Tax=uncultured Paenibacillus sp. TaxID=227322 RepID=UPI0015AAD020|nr:LysE family transporter [uncultured Paenibacillus sp.]